VKYKEKEKMKREKIKKEKKKNEKVQKGAYMKINRKNIFYIVFPSIILLGLLFSCNKGNKTADLTWKLNNGTLTISGKGPMPNYDKKGGPWCNLDNSFPNITAIIINDGVINIGNNAFVGNGTVLYVSIPGSVATIGENAFKDCKSITSIIIPNGVIDINDSAFQGCIKLISIDIPDSVLNIGKNAFMDCYSLLNVILGKNVTYIGIDAFRGCEKIQTVTSNNPIPPRLETKKRIVHNPPYREISDIWLGYGDISAFDSVSKKCRLVIPGEYIAAYKEDTEWNKFYNGLRPVIVQGLEALQPWDLPRSGEDGIQIPQQVGNATVTDTEFASPK
jgi:hypothetical protein